MNERILPVVVFSIAFLVSIYSAVSMPSVIWGSYGWLEGVVVLGILTSLSALALAYWFYMDYNENQETISSLEKRLYEIEAYLEPKKREERANAHLAERSGQFKKES